MFPELSKEKAPLLEPLRESFLFVLAKRQIISVSIKLCNYSIHFNQLEFTEYPYYFIMVSLFQMNKIKGSYEPTRVY